MKFLFMHIKNKNLTKKDKVKEIDLTNKKIIISPTKEVGNNILKEPKYEISQTKIKPTFKEKINNVKLKLKEDYKKAQELKRLEERWLDIMYHCRFKNEYKKTFTLYKLKHENYGFSCKILIPDGYCIDDLDNKINVIQNNIGCTFVLEKFSNKRYANAKFILIENCNKISFEPAKIEPYEVYLGVNEEGKPIKFNMNIEPMVLIAGATRMGKNGCIDHAIPSWIYYCSERQVQLYLFQFAKGDLGKYQKCKQVKCFSMNNVKKLLDVLINIKKEMDIRTKKLSNMLNNFKGDNIYDYNKLHPNKQLPYIYIIIDEFMDIANSEGDKETIKIKTTIISLLQSIAEYGGALGVNYIILHQKPEKALMPTFLKNQSNVRVCFGFKDEVCGRIVLGEDRGRMVTNLPPRKAYYISNTLEGYLYTTNLRNKNGSSRILNYIKSSMVDKKENPNVHHVSDCKIAKNSSKKQNDIDIKNKLKDIKQKMKKKNEEYDKNIKADNSIITDIEVIEQSPKKCDISDDIEIIEKVEFTFIPTNNDKSIQPQPNSNLPIISSKTKNKNLNIDSNFNKVNITKSKSKEDIIRENIKNIPNFVPYEPPSTNIKVIDMTDLAFKKSEKYKKDIKTDKK